MAHISDIKLIRTDTTLDLSQKAEKGMLWMLPLPLFAGFLVFSVFLFLFCCVFFLFLLLFFFLFSLSFPLSFFVFILSFVFENVFILFMISKLVHNSKKGFYKKITIVQRILQKISIYIYM